MTGNKQKLTEQKLVKDYTKIKFVVLSVLVIALLTVSALAPYLTPYDPYAQDLNQADRKSVV